MSVDIYCEAGRHKIEPVIKLLEYCKVQYKINRVKRDHGWEKIKTEIEKNGKADFVELPMLVQGDNYVVGTLGMMSYISTTAEKEEMIPLMVDNLLVMFFRFSGIAEDLDRNIERIARGAGNLDEFKKGYFDFVESKRLVIGGFEKTVGKNKWLLGNSLSLADFLLCEVIEKMKEIESDLDVELVGQYQHLESYICRFYAIPEIRDYRRSERFEARPFHSSECVWK